MKPFHANKPWAESSDQNRVPILEILREEFSKPGKVLEIGSGTGQHAVYFSAVLKHLDWQPSDVAENLSGIKLWIEESRLKNVHEPLNLNVENQWPDTKFDYVFSANTAHIMSWPQVQKMIEGVGKALNPAGKFCLYGPFNRDGKFTSESNERFESWLKSRDPLSGIRDIEAISEYSRQQGLALMREHQMPANNLILVLEKIQA